MEDAGGEGEKRYSWELGLVADSVLMGVSRDGSIPRPGLARSPALSGEWRRFAVRGAHLVARECHFSFGSPSRKLISAQRGWGLPFAESIFSNIQGATRKTAKKDVPRSSRTRDSSSAIRLRRRVVSSMVGSSLTCCVSTREGNSTIAAYLNAGSSIS